MRIKLGGAVVHPGALAALGEEIRFRTSIDVSESELAVDPATNALFGSLFGYVVGDSSFKFNADARKNLKRWLGLGGFVVFDNAGKSSPSTGFDASARAELTAMYPDARIRRVSPDHVMFRTFYRLDYPAGRAIHKPFIEGIKIGKRYAAVIIHNDLSGAFARDPGGSYANTPTPGGERQRELAIRLGVNLMMYASCMHYKDDQVHLDHLLHKRKWKIALPK